MRAVHYCDLQTPDVLGRIHFQTKDISCRELACQENKINLMHCLCCCETFMHTHCTDLCQSHAAAANDQPSILRFGTVAATAGNLVTEPPSPWRQSATVDDDDVITGPGRRRERWRRKIHQRSTTEEERIQSPALWDIVWHGHLLFCGLSMHAVVS